MEKEKKNKEEKKNQKKKKNIFSSIIEKLDKKLKEKAQKESCGCGDKKDGGSCC